jgi:hypothetical protein
MKKRVVSKRTSIPSARKQPAKPKRNRLWIGVNESFGLYTLPDPAATTAAARERYPGLPAIVQRGIACINNAQDRGEYIYPELVAMALGCGEYLSCDLDARTEEEAEL